MISYVSFHLLCLAGVAGSAAEKQARPLVGAHWVHTKDIRKNLNEVLDEALGKGQHRADDVRISELRNKLSPLYLALPKNSKGKLSHAAVRYALHRHFAHHHGMYIKGLEPAGESWNSSSPADILADRVPDYVQHMFEERLQDGFSLEEVAIFAATLEHFIHAEAKEKLMKAYDAHGFNADSMLDRVQIESVMDMYLMAYAAGEAPDSKKFQEVPERVAELAKEISQGMPAFPEMQSFLREVEEEVLENLQGGDNGPHGAAVSFEAATKVIETFTERFGKQQNAGCREISKALIAKEEHGTGRVSMRGFYEAGWQFRESKQYLKQFGVLDETVSAQDPSVVIPNYVLSMPNCLGSSSALYTVCCLDACDDILRHLETRIQAPFATPEVIEKLVATTPSSTVQAPRELDASLKARLTEIADTNKGKVPIHGRLFSQWLHHAYPRECPFPVRSGVAKPITPDEWLTANRRPASISDVEIDEIFSKPHALAAARKPIPWDTHEELVYHHQPPWFIQEIQSILRCLAMMAALFGLALALSKSAIAVVQPSGKDSKATV